MKIIKFLIFIILITAFLLPGCNKPERTPVPNPTSPSTTIQTNKPTTGLIPNLTARPSPAPNISSLKILGQVGGPTQAVAVSGNYAYVGVGLRLVVLDVSDPAKLHEIGTTESFGYYIEDIVVNGDTAFVAAGSSGLYIIDISNSAQPIIIRNYESQGYAESVTVVGKYAYLADGPMGLRVIDVTDRTHPVEIAQAYRPDYIFKIAIDGNYAYIAAAGAGLLVADVSDPAKPKEIGALNMPGYAYSLSVSGSVAYVADAWGGLHIVDISNPAQPEKISYIATPGWALDVATDGSLVYIAEATYGLRILDIADKNKPKEIGSYEASGGNAIKLTISKGAVYLVDRSTGLGIFDVSVPERPVRVGLHSFMGFADAVAVSGSYAYVAAGPYGLRVVDISDLPHPREIGFCDTKAYATGIVVLHNYAYVITYSSTNVRSGLHIINVSNPTQPKEDSFYAITGMAQDIVVEDNIAYIADESGLILIDVSNPSAPNQMGNLDFAQGSAAKAVFATWGVDVSGNMAYVTHGERLEVVDISNPQKPNIVGFYQPANSKKSVAVTIGGSVAYATMYPGGLHIVDISNPKNPKGIGSYNMESAQRLTVANDTLYIAVSGAGLLALNVSNPQDPTQSGLQRLPGYANGLTTVGNHIYVADSEGGLFIVEDTSKQSVTLQTSPQSALPGKGSQDIVVSDKSPPPVSQTVNTSGGISVDGDASDWDGIEPLVTDPVRALKALYAAKDSKFVYFMLKFDGGYTFSAGDISLDLDKDSTPDHNIHIPFPGDLKNKPPALFSISGSNKEEELLRISESVTSGQITEFRFPLSEFSANGFAITEIDIPRLGGNGYAPGLDEWTGYVEVSLVTASVSSTNQETNSKSAGLKAYFSSGHVITVNDSADSGQGTLRWALDSASRGDTITFDPSVFPPKTPVSIRLTTGLFLRQGSLIVDASNAGVILDGSNTSNGTIGLQIDSDYNTVKGLQILNFPGNGIQVNGSNNTIGGDRTLGNGPLGEGNLISRNDFGIIIIGDKVVGNKIVGNFIGVDISGKQVWGNRNTGIFISSAARNLIGGTTDAERNVIAGNARAEVSFMNQANGNTITGNYIGTDATGRVSLGTVTLAAVTIELGGFNNIIERNVISNEDRCGIIIGDWGSWYNEVIGNYIGVDATGGVSLGGKGGGIDINASFNKVGGTTPEERNIISGNAGQGIKIGWESTTDVVVIGNYIGTDVTGTKAIGNGIGVVIDEGTHFTFVGGSTESEQNLICGNKNGGVAIQGIGTDYNFVLGNNIGTNTTGTGALANNGMGIGIDGDHNFILRNAIITKNGKKDSALDNGNGNCWDNGKQGNYWSDYRGADLNGDGAGDTPYQIPPNGVDKYPLMKPFNQQ